MNNIINIQEYDHDVRLIAWKLCRGDRFLAEELISEMYISLLSSDVEKNRAYHLKEAKCRAIDYLRSRLVNYSYGGAFKHISLEVMEEAGFQIDTDGKLYSPSEKNISYCSDSVIDEDSIQ